MGRVNCTCILIAIAVGYRFLLKRRNNIVGSDNRAIAILTLGYVAKMRQPMRIFLIYLAHSIGLIAISKAIDVVFPNLSKLIWGIILVVLMAIEWCIYLYNPTFKLNANFGSLLRQSCWYFGLILGTLSYTYFLAYIEPSIAFNSFSWGLVWLVTPVMLTLIAKRTRNIRQRRLATIFSCISSIAAQLLILGQFETRFIGLAVAIWLMYLNAFSLRRTGVAVIHLGLVLAAIANVAYSLVNNWEWLLVGAITILGLYQLRQYFNNALNDPKFSYISQRQAPGILGVGIESQNFKLIAKYIKAADYWAIVLIVMELAGIGFAALALLYR